LERYYAGPGREDELVIKLPLGSYIPTFEHRRADFNGRRMALRASWQRLGFAPFVVCIAAVASLALYLVIMPAERAVRGHVAPLNTFTGPYWAATAVLSVVTVTSILFAWWINRN
jgi:hypothetical protein